MHFYMIFAIFLTIFWVTALAKRIFTAYFAEFSLSIIVIEFSIFQANI
jgi:hypothetical protein